MKNYDVFSIREYFPSIQAPSSSSWVFNQVEGLKNLGIQSLVISPTPKVNFIIKNIFNSKHYLKTVPSMSVEEYNGIDVIRPPYQKFPNKLFLNRNLYNSSKIILRAAEDKSADLIHAHFGHAGAASLLLKKNKNVPHITSFYGFDLGSDKYRLMKWYKQLCSLGDLFLVLSKDMANDLQSIGFPEEKILVHHLGVNVDKFVPIIKKQNSIFTFTVVAGFEERKGIQFVMDAFKMFLINKNADDFQLRIVGDGPFAANLYKKAEEFNSIVFINNYLQKNPRMTVLNEIQNSDVFLLTSITMPDGEKEGTPVVLLEAQSCGKPCIATRHAGIPEQIIDSKTGILVDERNVIQIQNAMELLYKNKEIRERMSINARINMIDNFNQEKQISKLRDIYYQLMKRK